VQAGTYVTWAGIQYIYMYIYDLNYACMSSLGLVGGKGDVRTRYWREHSTYIYIYIYINLFLYVFITICCWKGGRT